jgi:type II secretory pathway component PulC
MKESLNKTKKNIRNFFSFKKITPHTHWRNILYIFMILIVILIIFSLYLLNKIKNQEIFQISQTKNTQPVLINEKILKKVTESFDLKLLKEKEIKEGSQTYKDPSIN